MAASGGGGKSSGETVKVVVRCRPINGKERRENRKPIIDMDCDVCQVGLANPKDSGGEPKRFTFDSVYDENST